MDGNFIYEGRTIDYRIDDSISQKPKISKDGVEKLARYINFYSKGNPIGGIGIYDDVDIVFNITQNYALEQFKKYIKIKNLDKSLLK